MSEFKMTREVYANGIPNERLKWHNWNSVENIVTFIRANGGMLSNHFLEKVGFSNYVIDEGINEGFLLGPLTPNRMGLTTIMVNGDNVE